MYWVRFSLYLQKNWDTSTAWPVNKVRIEPSTSRLSLPVHNFTTLWGPRPPASPHKLWRNLRTKGRVPLKIAYIYPLNISKFALKKSGNFVCLGQADFCYKMWASNNCVELNPSATKLLKIKPDICKCFQKIFIYIRFQIHLSFQMLNVHRKYKKVSIL